MANQYQISNLPALLEKMTSVDKDFRFMATNDLMSELQNDSIKLDDDSERKIVKTLLKLLEDKNGEVQNLAVKCLGPLVTKVKEFQVETIVETLCSNMLSDKEQLKDISSIGLKTVINQLPQIPTQMSSSIVKKITTRLLNTIQKDDVSVQLETLDILSDILNHFGSNLISFHQPIFACLISQLNSQRLAVRKRAINAIGFLVASCNTVLFNELLEVLLNELKKKQANSLTKTYIQCLASISRQSGHRVGENLQKIIPLIVFYCQSKDEELIEYSLQAFESFIRRCPKEITNYIKQIIELCVKYISYDPNYNYDDEEDDANNDQMDDDENQNDENDQEDYSDDDDVSWKIRRAAAKCLDAIIGTRHEMITLFYTDVSPILIGRFKEREETVKSDIFNVYITLIQQTKPYVIKPKSIGALEPTAKAQSVDIEEKPVTLLKSQINPIVKSIHKLLKNKNAKTRQGCFSLLSQLVNVLPGALNSHISQIISGVNYSLGDKSSTSNMKIDTLNFLNNLLLTHDEKLFQPYLDLIIKPVIKCIQDSFYKIASDALLVSQHLAKILRSSINTNASYNHYALELYNTTLVRLKQTDIDQEVKERAINCIAQIICHLGDLVSNELKTTWPILVERLKNEITRLTAVKAINVIAESNTKVDLQVIFPEALPLLASFLRKNYRTLKLSAINSLLSIYKNYGNYITLDQLKSIIIVELPSLLSENDLHISYVALKLASLICKTHGPSLIAPAILSQVLVLVQSPLLQGLALESTIEFFIAIVNHKQPGLQYRDVISMLTKPIRDQNLVPTSNNGQNSTTTTTTSTTTPNDASNISANLAVHKQAFYSIAKCIAALTVQNQSEGQLIVQQFINDIKEPKSRDSTRLLGLLVLGETGKYIELSSHAELELVILDSFSSPIEEVKSAASYALGYLSLGNLNKYIPFILNEIDTNSKRQYLLFNSLKEIISYQSVNPNGLKTIKPFIGDIWNTLIKHCECNEEGTRNVVSECLGKLTLLDPQNLIQNLQSYLDSPSALARSTVVTAIKFTITDQPQPIDNLLKNCLGKFLNAIQDSDINVRRVALVTFNSAAHNKPSLVRDLLLQSSSEAHVDEDDSMNIDENESNSLIDHLYNETKIRKELIREVEMGPFKHTVDDGLDLRKAAFECMYTLLDSCLDRIDIFEFLNHVEDGLKDHYDIKMLAYLMLVRLSTLCPNALVQRLDRLIEPLKNTCLLKVKSNAVKQEYEKNDELKRSALRALLALLNTTDAEKNAMMRDFIANIRATPELAAMFEVIQRDAKDALNSVDQISMDTN